jgi:hypothetical protein
MASRAEIAFEKPVATISLFKACLVLHGTLTMLALPDA